MVASRAREKTREQTEKGMERGGNKNITIQMGWKEGTKGKTEERKIGKKI